MEVSVIAYFDNSSLVHSHRDAVSLLYDANKNGNELLVKEAGSRPNSSVKMAIFTKKDKAESNTNYAQGGIASVTSAGDDLEKHVEDTLEAGDGLCDPEVVREILRDGPARIKDLVQMGVSFSSLDDGRISLGKEGGHSKRRILHVKDVTGKAIEDALLSSVARKGVELFEHFFAIDLITAKKARKLGVRVDGNEDRILGIYFYDANRDRVVTVSSPVVLLATGGAGPEVVVLRKNEEKQTDEDCWGGLSYGDMISLTIDSIEQIFPS